MALVLIVAVAVVVIALYLWRRRRRDRAREAADRELLEGLQDQLQDAVDDTDLDLTDLAGLTAQRDRPRGTAPSKRKGDDAGEEMQAEEKIVILHVVAQAGRPFGGVDLASAFDWAGLRHGAMGIFHLVLKRDPRPVFSVANMVEPGTFDPRRMAGMTSPGLTLFMRLPGPLKGREAFDKMLGIARSLAEQLEGTVCDENRSPLARQQVALIRDELARYELSADVVRGRAQRH